MRDGPGVTAPRVAVVGVRRVRQGLGEHFARWLVAAGAEVPAFVARTPESADEGRRVLARHGIDARGFTSLDALLAAEPVDALVIASPAETHAVWLRTACAAGLGVLCEKPFVWGGADPAREGAAIVEEFSARRLLLREHCQWPRVLSAFFALHPQAAGRAPSAFEMELAPSGRGRSMIIDSLSHPVSVLQALPGGLGGGISGLSFSTRDPDAAAIDVSFRAREGGLAVVVRLRSVPGQPRPAAMAIDGLRADREVELPSYRMSLRDGARTVRLGDHVPFGDPMGAEVAAFVAALRTRGPAGADPGIVPRLRLLAEIAAAFG